MKICRKCHKTYDDSWIFCVNCQVKLLGGNENSSDDQSTEDKVSGILKEIDDIRQSIITTEKNLMGRPPDDPKNAMPKKTVPNKKVKPK